MGLYGLIDIFQFVIGDQYRENLFLIPILLLSYLFLGLYYNVSIWYKLSDKTYYGALISTIGAIITLGGSIILLPHYGVSASAWISLCCYVVMVVIGWQLGALHYAIHYPVARIARYILFTSLMLLILWMIHENLDHTLIAGAGVVSVYMLIIWRLEIKRLKALLV